MKRLIRLTLVSVICVIAVMVAGIGASAAYYGDLDGNDRVNSSDARKILRYAAKLDELAESDPLYNVADINQDGKVNSSDARLALRMAAQLEEYRLIPETDVPLPSETETQPPVPSVPDIPTPPEESTTQPEIPAPPEESTTVPSEETTVPPVEPTTAVNPADNIVYHDSFYMDIEIESASEGDRAVCVAMSSTKSHGVTLKSQFVKSNSFGSGKTIGIILKENYELLDLSDHKSTTCYIINFDSKEYIELGSLITNALNLDIDGLTGDISDSIAIPTFKSLDGLTASKETVNGKEYDVITVEKEDGSAKYYVEASEKDGYVPAVIEMYAADGTLTTRITVNAFDTDGSKYTSVPSGMKGYKPTRIDQLKDSLDFFTNLGLAS